jgi:hypothetical protein
MKNEDDEFLTIEGKPLGYDQCYISGSIFGERLRWSSLTHKRAELRELSLLLMKFVMFAEP